MRSYQQLVLTHCKETQGCRTTLIVNAVAVAVLCFAVYQFVSYRKAARRTPEEEAKAAQQRRAYVLEKAARWSASSKVSREGAIPPWRDVGDSGSFFSEPRLNDQAA